MKKILFSIIIILSINSTIKAQAWDGKGDLKLSAGYEFYGYFPNNDIGGVEDSFVSTIDYGITDYISVGSGVNYNFNLNNLYLNLRADYHFQHFFQLRSNFDVYTGADIGFVSLFQNDMDFGLHIGARFMFTDAIGIYLEIGNRGNAGLCYNF